MLLCALFVAFLFVLCQGVRVVLQGGEWELVCNSSAAFGVVLPKEVLLLSGFGALFLFGVQWWREEVVLLLGAWILLFAGGASNFVERLFLGCVTDYLTFPFIPTFNVADGLLTIGVGIIIVVNTSHFLKGFNE